MSANPTHMTSTFGLWCWVGRSPSSGMASPKPSVPATTAKCRRAACMANRWGRKASPISRARPTAAPLRADRGSCGNSRDPSSDAPNRTSPKRNRRRQNPAVSRANISRAKLMLGIRRRLLLPLMFLRKSASDFDGRSAQSVTYAIYEPATLRETSRRPPNHFKEEPNAPCAAAPGRLSRGLHRPYL